MATVMAVDTAAGPRWPRIVTFGTVLAAHALVIAGVSALQPTVRTMPTPATMTVHLVEIPALRPEPQRPAVKPAGLAPHHQSAQVRAPAQPTAQQMSHPMAPVVPAANHAVPVLQEPAASPPVSTPPMAATAATSTVRHDSPAGFDADYLNNPAPVYPAAARRAGEQGRVLLLVKVSPQGQAEQVELRQGSGFSRLDEAAMTAVRQWRFVPARRGDEPIAASVIVPITFRLGR